MRSSQFGAQYVAKQAAQAGDIPAGDYQIVMLYDYTHMLVNGTDLASYQFNAQLATINNSTSFRAVYVVTVNSTAETEQVTSYAYVRDLVLDDMVFSIESSPKELLIDFDSGDLEDDAYYRLYTDIDLDEPSLEWHGEEWTAEDDELVNINDTELFVVESYGDFESELGLNQF